MAGSLPCFICIFTQATIKVLRSLFYTHGLPEIIVSDNDSAFTSVEFAEFSKRNGIKQVFSAPHHPSSNGLAERAVQTVKTALKKATQTDFEICLIRFLFQ